MHQRKFPEALRWYDKSEEIAEEIHDQSLLAKIYRKKANLMMQSMEYGKGRSFISKSIAIYEQEEDSAMLGEGFGSLGWAYKIEKKYDSSIIYMKKAITVFEAKRYVTLIPVAYNEIGISNYETGKYEESLQYFRKAKKIYETLDCLLKAIHEFVDKIDTRFLKVDLYSEGLNERTEANTETVLYRVVQECVNNVIRHSGANHLDISLIRDADGISVTIEDNGRGFEASRQQSSAGIGL